MIRHRFTRRLLKAAALLAAAVAGLIIYEVVRLPDVRELVRRAPASTVLLDRRGNPLRYALTTRHELAPRVPLERIHPYLRNATIAAEDARFRSHPGFDVLAIARAFFTNLKEWRIVSGASTITMQVARLLRPLDRGWYGKFREAVLAARLEMALDKDEILELYLNLSPYGGNACGVEAASWRYFGRPPDDLSLAEAAMLAGLPQSPSRMRPDRYPDRARARRDWVLDRMEALGMIGSAACAEGKAAGIHIHPRSLPFTAPHFTTWALARVTPGARVRTTLDPALQAVAEETVRARLRALGPSGVRNGAAVVVETESGRIRALVGSQDFFARRAGQVNGACSPRSPGSLLKPFIYALAFEKGIAGPGTILHDRPRHFRDGYEPRNFAEEFVGPLTAREALVRSLNVPAVDLLTRVGVQAAIERLQAFGIGGIRRSASYYGLSLGLGGVEVTLLELVEAYATLGRLGEHRPLSFREGDAPAPTRRVLAPISAFQIADILEDVAWPPHERDAGVRLPRVALKTGTSFGFRDAWAIAYTPLWTVGVWFGNFDAEPSPALVGRSAAVPAALSLMRRLHSEDGGAWFTRPKTPPRRWTGGITHAPPRELRPAVPGGVTWVLPADGAIYVRHDRPGGRELSLRAEIETPSHLDGTSPGSPGAVPADPGAVQGSLAATAGGIAFDGRRPHDLATAEPMLCWFVDGSFAGRSRSGETLRWPLQVGTHRVTLVTHRGHSEVRTITVLP